MCKIEDKGCDNCKYKDTIAHLPPCDECLDSENWETGERGDRGQEEGKGEEMGYCILFPGLQELIEQMENMSDLKDLAERRAYLDMIASWNRRLRHLSEIRFRDSDIHTVSYNYHIKHLETVPPFYIMRNQEQDDKAIAMAEFWRKRAAWEEVDQH